MKKKYNKTATRKYYCSNNNNIECSYTYRVHLGKFKTKLFIHEAGRCCPRFRDQTYVYD